MVSEKINKIEERIKNILPSMELEEEKIFLNLLLKQMSEYKILFKDLSEEKYKDIKKYKTLMSDLDNLLLSLNEEK